MEFSWCHGWDAENSISFWTKKYTLIAIYPLFRSKNTYLFIRTPPPIQEQNLTGGGGGGVPQSVCEWGLTSGFDANLMQNRAGRF